MGTENYTGQHREPVYEMYAPKSMMSRGSSRMPYVLGHSRRMTDSEGPIIEGFHYDPETFRVGYTNKGGKFIQTGLPPYPIHCPIPNSRDIGG